MNEIQQRILFEQVGYAIEDLKTALLQSLPQAVSRRERIATAALPGVIAKMERGDTPTDSAIVAVGLADALIAELDKPSTNESAASAQGATA